MIELLNSLNSFKILPIEDPAFATYGRVLIGYDMTPYINYLKEATEIPDTGNIYVRSVPEMEAFPLTEQLRHDVYGDAYELQVGYCNGRNSTFNGFEYHKGSELNIAVCDMCLSLGHTWDIKDGHYSNSDAQVFFVKAGTAFEMFQTTLHLSPLKVSDDGFKACVVLPLGTNSPLDEQTKQARDRSTDPECRLLLQRNKWVIAHPDREPLIKQGAFPGIIGENTELKYK